MTIYLRLAGKTSERNQYLCLIETFDCNLNEKSLPWQTLFVVSYSKKSISGAVVGAVAIVIANYKVDEEGEDECTSSGADDGIDKWAIGE